MASAEALFADLGPYAWILGQWLARPGVEGWLDEHAGERRGFALLAFYREAATPGGPRAPVADLLALGVVARFRGQGLGRALLEHAVAAAGRAAPSQGIDALRLTVAADNLGAQQLYAEAGFVLVDAPAAAYPSGTPARLMVRPLP
ncbi:MAG: GNAT family N-acetyltransferase [Kofleriaceae bacterium]